MRDNGQSWLLRKTSSDFVHPGSQHPGSHSNHPGFPQARLTQNHSIPQGDGLRVMLVRTASTVVTVEVGDSDPSLASKGSLDPQMGLGGRRW